MRIFVAVSLALVLFSVATGCDDKETKETEFVFQCPADDKTNDQMVSYAIDCIALYTEQQAKINSQVLAEKCLTQANYFYCKRVEKERVSLLQPRGFWFN